MYDILDDTIVAVASPPGLARRGIVRSSGPNAVGLAAKLFKTADESAIDSLPGFRRCDGEIELEPGCSVPADLYLFRAPRSYTRQDCVEFHVPGSPAILSMLMRRMMELGARSALPGEFTARAFLNGAMNLTRAEAVASVIHARSDGQLLAARSMMEGRLAAGTDKILEQTAELLALVEADIDFAEEPIEFITPDDLRRRVADIADQLARLVAAADSSERIDVLPRILLVGRSNAGKSTLMNALSGMDRSICSPVPGTTRDLLSAPIALGPAEAVLIDAAGVDDDVVDLMRLAGQTTAAEASRADLVCLVVDLSAGVGEADFQILTAAGQPRSVVVGNKIDLLADEEIRGRSDEVRKFYSGAVCAVSARTGAGLDACRRLFAETLHAPDSGYDEGAVPVTARQRDAIDTAVAALNRCAAEAGDITETIDRADILAFELREALDALGSISGSVTTEDLLQKVFASFCIGK